jgi:hypothetical protein
LGKRKGTTHNRVGESLVGDADLLEHLLCVGYVWVLIGMVLNGKPAIGLLDPSERERRMSREEARRMRWAREGGERTNSSGVAEVDMPRMS